MSVNFNFLESEKVVFTHDFDEIAGKISQILPFSKILLILTDTQYFEFGKEFFNNLVRYGLKVVNLIYNHNIDKQVEDLIKDYSFIDVRGVIVFSKKVLLNFSKNFPNIEQVFFVQKDVDINGVFVNNNLEKVNYFFNDNLFDEEYARKSFAIKTVYLIDYVFRNTLISQRVDTLFFAKLKKMLVSAIFYLNDFKDNNKKLFNLNLELEYLIGKSFYPFSSINVCSYLYNKDFFDFECLFYFSNEVIKKVKEFLSGKLVNENFDFRERAKLVCFLTNGEVRQTLLDLKNQTKNIKCDNVSQINKEIKKLCVLYQDFVKGIKKTKSYKNVQEELLKTCLSVCGDTRFSINFSTFFREIIFN